MPIRLTIIKCKKIRKRIVKREFSQKVGLFFRRRVTGYQLLQSDLFSCPEVCYKTGFLIQRLLMILIFLFPLQIQLDNEKLRRDVRLSGSRLDLPQLCNGSRRLDGHNNHVAANETTVTTTSLNGNGNSNGNHNNNIGSPVSSSTTNSSNGGNERGSSTKSNSSSGSGSSGNSASSTGSAELKCNTPMTPSGERNHHY